MSKASEITILSFLCCTLFAGCLLVYTQHNSFPYYSHADEQSKVRQLFNRDFNFNHPQLMLVSVDLVRLVRGQHDGYQRVAETGRWVSAVFAASSVVLLALLGWREYGLLGALSVGLLVAVCPILGVTAHFLKEDTALLFGITLTCLALHFWLERPTGRRLILLGLATGLAASGKYIGALSLLAVVPLVLFYSIRPDGKSWYMSLVQLVVPAAVSFSVINWPMFVQPEAFVSGVEKGAELVVHGRSPVALPNLRVFRELGKLSWPVLLLAQASVLFLVLVIRRGSAAGWILLVTGATFTGLLLLTPLPATPRYILLPAVSLYALAGLAIPMLAQHITKDRKTVRRPGIPVLAGIVAVLLFLAATPVFRSMALDAFYQADARADLIAWANLHLEADDVLAAPQGIRLPGIGGRELADPAIQFLRSPVTLNMGNMVSPKSLVNLRGMGVTHVVVRRHNWERHQATSEEVDLPEVVWKSPKRFERKNRWLRCDLMVLRI